MIHILEYQNGLMLQKELRLESPLKRTGEFTIFQRGERAKFLQSFENTNKSLVFHPFSTIEVEGMMIDVDAKNIL